ncbi:MAG: serine/threonine protein kinase [Deltaproteobacteria bacterium]|nr:serine/threonine protein kinase [Deltaproteobacteria bacterium]
MPIDRFRRGDLVADRFRLDHPLGGGGMGVVWAATDIASHARLALKVIRCDGEPSPAQRKRLVLEARAAMIVQHPNVVRVLDVVESPAGEPVVVMELLHGKPLSGLLEGGAVVSPRKLAQILLPVVAAVAAAHARGVVHRDLKPENIFRVYDGARRDVRVLDFGVAKLSERAIGDETAVRTAAGFAVGTLPYMAPEQLLPGGRPDHRVDVWALGVIAYECLAGRRPFDADHAAGLIAAIRRGASCPRQVPPELARLVEQMLAFDPARRPGLPEVYQRLSEHLVQRVPATRLAPTPARAMVAAAAAATGRKTPRGLRLAAMIAIPAAVFLAGFAVGWYSAGASDAATTPVPERRHEGRPRRAEVVGELVPARPLTDW